MAYKYDERPGLIMLQLVKGLSTLSVSVIGSAAQMPERVFILLHLSLFQGILGVLIV